MALTASCAGLSELDYFVRSCGLLDADEINRTLLIATECFENILQHSRHPKSIGIAFCRKPSGRLEIRIDFHSCNFRDLMRQETEGEPYYDEVAKRYRGLGLRMCRNLSSSITYRKGLLKNTIVIIL
jgi:anti-sigma regulatory factor (Ser/Thr protein kinase)